MTILIIICVSLAFLAREGAFFIERRQWAKERQKLLDRVQAGTLVQYKAFDAKPKKPKERKKGVEFL